MPTDALGNFGFSQVTPGEYYLIVADPAYQEARWPASGEFAVLPGAVYVKWQIPVSPARTHVGRRSRRCGYPFGQLGRRNLP